MCLAGHQRLPLRWSGRFRNHSPQGRLPMGGGSVAETLGRLIRPRVSSFPGVPARWLSLSKPPETRSGRPPWRWAPASSYVEARRRRRSRSRDVVALESRWATPVEWGRVVGCRECGCSDAWGSGRVVRRRVLVRARGARGRRTGRAGGWRCSRQLRWRPGAWSGCGRGRGRSVRIYAEAAAARQTPIEVKRAEAASDRDVRHLDWLG